MGKAYTFQLDGGPDIYLTGATSLTLTASAVVTAQNLRVTEHTGSALTLTWDEPAAPVTGWSVRCYDSADFDQTVTVDSCTATIEGISADTAYTVEVTAAGMSQNAWISITANPSPFQSAPSKRRISTKSPPPGPSPEMPLRAAGSSCTPTATERPLRRPFKQPSPPLPFPPSCPTPSIPSKFKRRTALRF